VTEPVAALGEIVAVNVTDEPNTAGLEDEEIDVELDVPFMVCVNDAIPPE
jgi:hypothetical protein